MSKTHDTGWYPRLAIGIGDATESEPGTLSGQTDDGIDWALQIREVDYHPGYSRFSCKIFLGGDHILKVDFYGREKLNHYATILLREELRLYRAAREKQTC